MSRLGASDTAFGHSASAKRVIAEKAVSVKALTRASLSTLANLSRGALLAWDDREIGAPMMGVNQSATNIQKATMMAVNPVRPPSRMPVADSAPEHSHFMRL